MSDTKTALSEINEAIRAIQNGAQSYKIGQQSVTKANLATLYAERQRLDDLIQLGILIVSISAICKKDN